MTQQQSTLLLNLHGAAGVPRVRAERHQRASGVGVPEREDLSPAGAGQHAPGIPDARARREARPHLAPLQARQAGRQRGAPHGLQRHHSLEAEAPHLGSGRGEELECLFLTPKKSVSHEPSYGSLSWAWLKVRTNC